MARKNSTTETTTNATTTTTQATEAKKTTRTTRAKAAQVPAEIKPEPIPERTIDFSPMGKVNGWVSSRQRTVKQLEDIRKEALALMALAFIVGAWFGQWLTQLDYILH